MSESQDMGQQIAQQAGGAGKSIAKKAGGKMARKALGAAGKALKKLAMNFIKSVISGTLKALVAYIGPIGLAVIIACVLFLAVLDSIPGADWFLGGGTRSVAQAASDKDYENNFKKLADDSVVELDKINANPDWKAEFKNATKPSWGIPAALARYQIMKAEQKIDLPDPKTLFKDLQPKFTYQTISDDVERTKTVKTTCDETGCTTSESITTTVRAPHKILKSVWTPYGDVQVQPLKRFYRGDEPADFIKDNKGATDGSNVWRDQGTTTSEDGKTTTTTYFQYEKTEVEDRGITPYNIDQGRLKGILMKADPRIQEADIPMLMELIATADPYFPKMQFDGSNQFEPGGLGAGGGAYSGDIPPIEIKGGWAYPAPFCRIVTSGYGMRDGVLHAGVDLAGPGEAATFGKPIVAAKDGFVVFATTSPTVSGYGHYVIIAHDEGIQTRYGHMSQVFVHSGQQVKAGQVIALVGNTGVGSGSHLHFEVILTGMSLLHSVGRAKDLHSVNPWPFIQGL